MDKVRRIHLPFVLENKDKEWLRAEVCSGKIKIAAPLLSEICNVGTVDVTLDVVVNQHGNELKIQVPVKSNTQEKREYGWEMSLLL